MGDASIDHGRDAPTHTAPFLVARTKPLAAIVGVGEAEAILCVAGQLLLSGLSRDGAVARMAQSAAHFIAEVPSGVPVPGLMRFDGNGAPAIGAAVQVGQHEGFLVAMPA